MSRPVYSLRFNLSVGTIVSLVFHGLLLTVVFAGVSAMRSGDNSDMEVILVNAHTETAPTKADKLAQVNLDRGGNTDELNHTVSTPLPSLQQTAATTITEQKTRQVEELEEQRQQLVMAVKSQVPLATATALREDQADPSPETGADDEDQQRQIINLEGKISREIHEYQSRPRRHDIGARAKSVPEALYVEEMRVKIMHVAELNYPVAARKLHLYGEVLLSFDIRQDGTLASVPVIKIHSGQPILDAAAVDIISKSAPFPPFPKELAKVYDVIGVSRHMVFTRSDRLETESSD